MTALPTQSARDWGLRTVAVCACAAGLGIGLSLALVVLGYDWYRSRPQPWSTRALEAKPSGAWLESGSSGRMPAFQYEVTNRTDQDWDVKDASGLDTFLLTPSAVLDAVPSAVAVDTPIFIPAGQTGTVVIRLRMYSDKGVQGSDRVVIAAPSQLWHGYEAIVVFDRAKHYRIDFPKAW